MEVHKEPPTTTVATTITPEKFSSAAKKSLLLLHCILLSIGNCGGLLVLRLYFIHNGHRIWLISCIQTVGWPFIFLILTVLYFHRRASAAAAGGTTNRPTTIIYMRRRLFFAVTFIGVLTGLDNYLYTYGIARLPVSTYALITGTKLVFVAVFAFFLVKQKFTPYSINAVVLLTLGSAMLAFHASSDRPAGESNIEYILGFLLTVAASGLYGLLSPMLELTYARAKQVMTYTLVLEVEMIMCIVATVVCIVGMIVNNDFKVMPREAEEFGLGKMKYYLVLSTSIVFWQCFFLGAIGVIFYGSSLLLGVILTVQIPVIEILGVIFFKEQFKSEKGVALFLSLWGFVSYFYGDYKHMKERKEGIQSTPEGV